MKKQFEIIGLSLYLCCITQVSVRAAADGLVLHYTFDNDEGDRVPDASGNGRTAKVNGAAWVADGALGGAYRFDNNSQNLTATDAGLPSGDAPRTLAMWLKMDKNQAKGCTGMLGYGTNGFNRQSTGIGFDWRENRDRVYFSPGGACFLSESKLPAPGTWLHAAYTYDGSGAHHLYINGLPNDGMSELGGPVSTLLSGVLLLGGQPGGEGPDGGYLDDVRIYDRALSQAEVAALAGGATSIQIPAAGPAAGNRSLPPGFQLGFLAGACFGGILAGFICLRRPKAKAPPAQVQPR
jgi:hypothetical protein